MNIESYFKITYGLYIVSAGRDNKLNGYISNTVFQVTAEPPQLAVACSKNNFTSEIISQSKTFSISVLKKESKADIIGTFGYKSGRDINKFEHFNFRKSVNETPILLEDVIAWFECEVIQTFDVGTHLLFVGKVIDGDILDNLSEPLTYSYYREVKKGKAPKNAPTYIAPEKLISKPDDSSKSDKYYCTACGYIYDPLKGDPESDISPGTRFEDLPDTWVCPSCGTEKTDFEKVN